MFKPFFRILLKFFELLGCVACVVMKALTDQEARRVALRNQKYSMEWSLLNNVTWSREGNAFANVTYGGYTLITSLLLITRCINAKSRPPLTEKVFLTVGMLFFLAMAGLVLASLDQVTPDLQDNAIILGCLSFFVAFLFIIDLADKMARYKSSHMQTEHTENIQTSTQTIFHNEIKQLNIPVRVDITPTPSPDIGPIPPNGYYFTGDQVDVVQAKVLPAAQRPVFAKVLLPEKKRPTKNHITQPKRLQEDEDLFIMDDIYHASPKRNSSKGKDNISDEDNFDRPISSGFVAQAARIWERRAKRSRTELSTVV